MCMSSKPASSKAAETVKPATFDYNVGKSQQKNAAAALAPNAPSFGSELGGSTPAATGVA